MASKKKRRAARHADPSLESRPSRDRPRPFGAPRWLGFLLLRLFWFLLLIPKFRRLRRSDRWPAYRKAGVFAWTAVGAASLWYDIPWLGFLAAAGALGTALLVQKRDPDHERKLQRVLRADYCLNGGQLAEWPERWNGQSRKGDRFFVFLKGPDLLFVPREGDDEDDVRHRLSVRKLTSVRVDGEPYQPVYVSEAKDPPRLDVEVDKKATSQLQLDFDDGDALVLNYSGGFAKHLAETAAHAVYSTWRLECPDRVAGQSPKVLHVIGG